MVVAVCLHAVDLCAASEALSLHRRCFSSACARRSTRRCWWRRWALKSPWRSPIRGMAAACFLGNSICYLGGLILMKCQAPSSAPERSGPDPCDQCFTSSASAIAGRLRLARHSDEGDFHGVLPRRRDGGGALVFLAAVPTFRLILLCAFAAGVGCVRGSGVRDTWKRDTGWVVVIVCGSALGAGRFVLFLRAGFGHDRSADAMGLSAHGGGIFPRAVPRPI